MMNDAYINSTIEAIILASPDPIPARKIAQVVNDATPSRVGAAVAHLNQRYADSGSSFRIREIAGGFQHYILPEYVGFVEELFARRRKLRLTRAALETVSIIAYRQPVTKSEIEHIRGVASDGVLQNLLEKGMISITGRAETVGRPLQYGTTDEFLQFFGLASLSDLPRMSEIEQIIAAEESRSQTELELMAPPEDRSDKLNVADGTFEPSSRQKFSDMDEDEELDHESTDRERVEDPSVPEPPGRLILKSPLEADDSSDEESTLTGSGSDSSRLAEDDVVSASETSEQTEETR